MARCKVFFVDFSVRKSIVPKCCRILLTGPLAVPTTALLPVVVCRERNRAAPRHFLEARLYMLRLFVTVKMQLRTMNGGAGFVALLLTNLLLEVIGMVMTLMPAMTH